MADNHRRKGGGGGLDLNIVVRELNFQKEILIGLFFIHKPPPPPPSLF